MAYNQQQFGMAYRALCNLYQGLKHVDMEEVIRHFREATATQTDPNTLKNSESIMDVLEATKALRDTMKLRGVPRMPDDLAALARGEDPRLQRANLPRTVGRG